VAKPTGTYFEIVPKTVVEKILAQQVRLLHNELIRVAGSSKRTGKSAANKAATKATTRKPKR
jgi:hypothetical protein